MKKNVTIHLSIFILYCLCSAAFFGPHIFPHFSTYVLGTGTDPHGAVWGFAYWLYVLTHHFSLVYTNVIWYPDGLNLAHALGTPVVGFLIAPLTYFFGPVVTFNLLSSIFILALSAYCAYLLCFELTHSKIASFVGGYIFGFSTIHLSQSMAHYVCVLNFLLPLLLLWFILYFKQKISTSLFVVLSVFLLVFQFFNSSEMLVVFTLFAGLSGLITYIFHKDLRRRLAACIFPVFISYILFLILLSPYLFYFFTGGGLPFGKDVISASTDLMNLIIPTPITWLGGNFFLPLSKYFPSNVYEAGGYLGLPLIVIVILFIKQFKNTRIGNVLMVAFFTTLLAELGPFLHIFGNCVLPLPWLIVSWLPILKLAMPARLSILVFLVIAMMAAIWLTQGSGKRKYRYLLAILAIIFILPNPKPLGFKGSPRGWVTNLHIPHFISSGNYTRFIKTSDVVLAFPKDDFACIWQAKTRMSFKMADDCASNPPIRMQKGFKLLSKPQMLHDTLTGFSKSMQRKTLNEILHYFKEAKINVFVLQDNERSKLYNVFFDKLRGRGLIKNYKNLEGYRIYRISHEK